MTEVGRPGRNDPCPCGSGKKYKKCHGAHRQTQAPRRRAHPPSLQARNLAVIDAVRDIFGTPSNFDWGQLRRTISGDQIRELYTVIGEIWPPDTDLSEIIPAPSSKLRGLYLGDVGPQELARSVLRFGLYADEILIVDPFMNPWTMRDEYNPVVAPDMYKADTVKLLLFLILVEPWIRKGLLGLIPDPGDFDPELRNRTWALAEERTRNRDPSDVVDRDFEKEVQERGHAELRRAMLRMPASTWEAMAREHDPNMSAKQIAQLIAHVRRERAMDPLAVDQTVSGAGSEMMVWRTGANLELALYLAQMTGAFPYTNLPPRWDELMSVKNDLPEASQVWTPLSKAFGELDFQFLNRVDPGFAASLRADGRLESFRSFLRRVWSRSADSPESCSDGDIRAFKDDLIYEYRKARAEWASIDRNLLTKSGLITLLGAGASAIVTGGFSPAFAGAGFALGAVTQLVDARLKRGEFRKETPMSVFVDLSRKRRAQPRSG